MEALLSNPAILFFAALRPLGMCVMFPLLGARNLGSTLLRNGVILAFSIPVVPLYIRSPAPVSGHSFSALFVGQELMIGVLIGLVMAIPFWALDSAGFIVDTIRGSSMGSVLNPSLGEAASVLGILFVQLFIALFFMYGGLNQMLAILYRSYQIIPPGARLQLSDRWLALLLAQWRTLFTLCISFVLPSVVVMVLTDLAIGLMNRSAQQLNVFFLAMPIKSAMALVMLIISLWFSVSVYFTHLDSLPLALTRLLEGLSHE
ncbi:type III secretion system export apparatus subunit SctT [Erwinia sp. HR93]|uniref:type III secretion system export apparatus subunit SctT n=1 Tax=Erwinia sp. HR93 TaxID=3094840 RepID=UPI002ADEC6BE|nr:type III secretion system export apparatus subunit SctT [Erwinia sp. HR93]MEA1063803.1 type III secretion system export apparatus subunit SctT [Erwinia sp. HR93]